MAVDGENGGNTYTWKKNDTWKTFAIATQTSTTERRIHHTDHSPTDARDHEPTIRTIIDGK
jgi:hypothetical protein